MWHLVDLILAHVSRAGDLCSVALVSPTWRACLAGSPVHDLRRQAYVEEKKRDRENFGQSGASVKTRSSPRLAMQEVNRNLSPSTKRNRNETASSGSISSPNKIRNRLFDDVSSSSAEKLVHCPNCSASSPVVKTQDGKGLASCSSKTCGLVFCSTCLYSEHPGQPCRTVHVSTRSKTSVVSSKKSKARLRRL